MGTKICLFMFWENGFITLGLGFNHWEKGLTISKMGMGFLSFHDLRLYYLTKLLKCAYFLI